MFDIANWKKFVEKNIIQKGIAYHARSYVLVVSEVDRIQIWLLLQPNLILNSARVGSVYTRLIYYYVTAITV